MLAVQQGHPAGWGWGCFQSLVPALRGCHPAAARSEPPVQQPALREEMRDTFGCIGGVLSRLLKARLIFAMPSHVGGGGIQRADAVT